MLPSFKSKIGNVYYPVYILELLTSVDQKTPKWDLNSDKHLEMGNWELVVVSNELCILTTTHKYPQIPMFALVLCVLSGD